MKTNKIFLGGIAGAIVFFFLGWLIYGVLLADFMESNYDQSLNRPMEEMVWWALILSNLASGFLFAIILSWSNTIGIADGAKKGAILGFLLGLSMDLSFYAMSKMILSFTPIIVDVLLYTILWAIMGAVIVWVMSLVKNKA
ncbi:MAG: hypothetical protein PF484_03270 [Bacteroidales bacterium]|jgi:uncharacterized membrane-anchored protein|nr:hypothetical protein [Bacteroidales bacterium]